MNIMTVLRLKNRWLGYLMPTKVAKQNADLFLTPRKYPRKDWEEAAEKTGQRCEFSGNLSAIRWGESKNKILLMHGWEGRATQMYGIAKPLIEQGYEVIAIDAPMHGNSKGDKSNPVEFANAIVEANTAFGPFYGAIGHSMGACSLAIAYEKGCDLGRYALIASPSCIEDVLKGFAGFMGLSAPVSKKFIRQIETVVGRSARELDVGDMLKGHKQDKLLLHAKDDREIPYESMLTIKNKLNNVETISLENLGHRKIMRDDDTIARLLDFMRCSQKAVI